MHLISRLFDSLLFFSLYSLLIFLDNKLIANPLQDTIIFDTNQLPKNKYSSESEEEEEEMIPEETEDVLKAKEWIERHNNNNEYEEKPSSQKAPLKRTLQEMETGYFTSNEMIMIFVFSLFF